MISYLKKYFKDNHPHIQAIFTSMLYIILHAVSSNRNLPNRDLPVISFGCSLIASPSVCAVPASVFLHIIAIRRQAVCKHDAAFAIGLFVQIVPLSVHKYPAALHAGLRINIEPAAISAVADPAGHCVAVLAESPPKSKLKNSESFYIAKSYTIDIKIPISMLLAPSKKHQKIPRWFPNEASKIIIF